MGSSLKLGSKGVGCGEGVSLPTGRGLGTAVTAPPQKKNWHFLPEHSALWCILMHCVKVPMREAAGLGVQGV